MAFGTRFKLATWNPRNQCFDDAKVAHATEAEARASAKHGGRYRVSEITDEGRTDGPEFTIEGPPAPAKRPPKGGGLRKFAAPWRMYGQQGGRQ